MRFTETFMIMLWLLASAAQCLLLLFLWRRGRRAALRAEEGAPPLEHWNIPPERLPTAALFIPAAGRHPAMPDALRSLLRQDYPRIIPVLVTATDDDPAAGLARQLQEEFPALRHVAAGRAQGCGQKNHNTLCGIASVGDAADVYVFCDSTHTARPDFVRQLIWPIAAGEAAFSTGYHQVVARDDAPVTRAYQISVLLMRLLQAVSAFTQPWGGGMAMSRAAFERYGIGQFWADNVVDDCSLASLLLRRRTHVRLCPRAILDTGAEKHHMDVWRAWMDRQVLFLKFCIPMQWRLLGVLALLMAAPPLFSLLAVLGGPLLPPRPAMALLPLAGLAHLGLLAAVMLGWRELARPPAPIMAWLAGFVLAVGMFVRVYCASLRADGILWHGIRYRVGPGGRVEGMERTAGG